MHLTTRFWCFFEPRTRLTPSTIIHPSAASPIVRSMPTATAVRLAKMARCKWRRPCLGRGRVRSDGTFRGTVSGRSGQRDILHLLTLLGSQDIRS